MGKKCLLNRLLNRMAAIVLCLCCASKMACAEEDYFPEAPKPSPNNYGEYGLIRIPSARVPEASSLILTTSWEAPYLNDSIGFQPLPGLTATIRQANDLKTGISYPGIDMKLLLLREGKYIPQTALGYSHMIGADRFGGEYLVFSKRYWALDFTAGVGWGRYASDSSTTNPLTWLGNSFENQKRNGRGDSGVDAWWTGSRMGVFGGVEYSTPIEGLNLKVEYNPDNYINEKRDDPDFVRRSDFNVGATYNFWEGWTAGAAWEAGDRVMLRLAWRTDPAEWNLGRDKIVRLPKRVNIEPEDLEEFDEDELLQRGNKPVVGQNYLALMRSKKIQSRAVKVDQKHVTLWVDEQGRESLAQSVGDSASVLDTIAPPQMKEFRIIPENKGLSETRIDLVRDDIKRAKRNASSPQEVWQNTEIHYAADQQPDVRDSVIDNYIHPFLRARFDASPYEPFVSWTLRESTIYGVTSEPLPGIVLGGAVRAVAGQNTHYIVPSLRPVRSLVNEYNGGVEQLYAAWFLSPMRNLHWRLDGGIYEEMYQGYGGEILYQPLKARWALGLDVHRLSQRDPYNEFGTTGYETSTGFVSFYYEALPYRLTAIARAGRYLAGDWGATAELNHRFDNGVKLGGQVTWTDAKDISGPEPVGHFDAGLHLIIPFGDTFAFVPDDTEAQFRVKSLGRDAGQRAEIPHPLFEETRPVSTGWLINSWGEVLDWEVN